MPSHQPRRLYLRLYLAFLGVMVAVFALSLGASFLFGRGGLGIFRQGPRFAEHLTRMLPPSHDTEGMARTVLQMHDELGVDVSVVDLEGNVLSASGAPIAVDPSAFGQPHRNSSWILRSSVFAAPVRQRRGGPPEAYLLVRVPEGGRVARIVLWLSGVLLVSLALVYPLSRSITRPLERLTATAESFGRGDRSARSGIKSEDEVGRLARSFDEMASRIEETRKSEKELLANVSHELRTPLARIRVAMELIEPRDETVKRRLSVVAEELDELERLVADVLTASRLDLAQSPLKRDRFSAEELVQKGRNRILALEPGRDVQADVQAGLALEGDEGLLSRALDNLLDNARKYGGGPDKPIRVEARREGAETVLAVSDAGEGIPPEELERIFDPFYRGSSVRHRTGGFGLGLALARRVAEAHGGRIRAHNQSGGGARIEMRIPAGPPELPPP
ncbi:MAG: HAMP domain-containing histidine kinase [Deltaproteobacteria bacterium]|nr:MAG: HAMP domain-containing histidine kinase [Deltaproteobacteria bacterium]